MVLFSPDLTARFVDRPNRFIARAAVDGKIVDAHCPNPGRLEEILHPGRELILEKAKSPGGRKTEYSLAAAVYKNKVIPLQSGRANLVARELILPLLFPDFDEITPEYGIGSSRFDFLVRRGKERHLVEVKACTLVEGGTAMFPDAPSLRAGKHLRELAELAGGRLGIEEKTEVASHVVFVIMHGDAERFVPNIHTDPDFAETLRRVRDRVRIHACSAETSSSGEIVLSRQAVPVEFRPVELVKENRGNYLLLIEMNESPTVPVGALGNVDFREGYYVYVGSASANLRQRIARHLRKKKKTHWHVDYLLAEASGVKAYPIYSFTDRECSLAREIAAVSDGSIEGFGCSDCACESHLFYFGDKPTKRQEFTDILFGYRHGRGLFP